MFHYFIGEQTGELHCLPEDVNPAFFIQEYFRPATEAEVHAMQNPPETFTEIKAKKRDEINAACDTILDQLTGIYPASEIQSFSQQVAEAKAFQENPDDIPPLLSSICTSRGISLDELAGRVMAKHMAFSRKSGWVLGQRKLLEEKLEQCQTIEQVQAIRVDIALPDGIDPFPVASSNLPKE